MTMILPDDLAERIDAAAKDRNMSPEDLLHELLRQASIADKNNILLQSALSMDDVDVKSPVADLSERFNDYLRQS